MRHLYAVIFCLTLAGTAHAQQTKTYTFNGLSPDEANTVLNKLGEMPWKDVNPLLQKLIAQVNSQNSPPPAPPPAAAADPSKE